MKRTLIVIMALSLIGPALAADRTQAQAPPKAKLPPAVLQAVKAECPGAVIAKLEVDKEAGINLYDIEFKAGRGEIEVAEDGTVMDVATVVALKDIPKAAAEAILKAAAGAKIAQLEKSEVRAEIRKDGEKGTIVKLSPVKYVYEAELVQGEKRGEVQAAPDGTIVEGPKWGADEEEKEEQAGQKGGAEEKEAAEVKAAAGVDLKILPNAVLEAFAKAYPKAVIRGASKEVEKGVTYYEIESVDGKMNRDLLYAADGRTVEVEEGLAPGALPPEVLKALAKAYPGYKMLKAEELVKDGQKLFELMIRVGGEDRTVTIDPDGKIKQ